VAAASTRGCRDLVSIVCGDGNRTIRPPPLLVMGAVRTTCRPFDGIAARRAAAHTIDVAVERNATVVAIFFTDDEVAVYVN